MPFAKTIADKIKMISHHIKQEILMTIIRQSKIILAAIKCRLIITILAILRSIWIIKTSVNLKILILINTLIKINQGWMEDYRKNLFYFSTIKDISKRMN